MTYSQDEAQFFEGYERCKFKGDASTRKDGEMANNPLAFLATSPTRKFIPGYFTRQDNKPILLNEVA